MKSRRVVAPIAARAVARALVLLLVCAALAARSAADEVTVMTSGAFTAAYLELLPELERRAGTKVVTATTTMGTGRESIPSRLERGEAADVVIVAADALDALIAAGLVLRESRVDLARSSIGMAVRAGAAKPDISTVEALTQALLNARSIAYSASVSGTYLATELFPRLGIAEAIADKVRRIERERVGAVVARGEAEIGFQQISELLPIPGLEIVGPLPADVQRVTVFSAGIASASTHVDTARALIRFLVSDDAAPVVARTGLEPLAGK